MLVAFLLLTGFAHDMSEVRRFELPGEDIDAYLADPYSFAFAPSGELFVVDRLRSSIFVWSADGRFTRAWGKKGEGPGEMEMPFHLTASRDEIYVLELRRQVSVFTHDGRFLRHFKLINQPRAMTRMAADRFCLIYPNEGKQVFEMVNGAGETFGNLAEIESRYLIDGRPIAYAPEAEMQRGGDGRFYLGFSQDAVVLQADEDGKILGKKTYELMTSLPTEEDKEVYDALDLYAPWRSTGRARFRGVGNRFDMPKGYYNHFLVKGDKIAFIHLPTGGMWGVGLGHAEGRFTICDFTTGKRLSVGAFSFPADSMVLYEDDRCLGFIVDDEGDRQVIELTLKGL